MPLGLSALDAILGTLMIVVVANAGRRGFLREAGMLLGFVLGFALASRFARDLASMIWHEGASAQVILATFLGILLVVLVIVTLTTGIIRPALNNPALRTLDFVAGLGVGLCEGVLLLGAVASLGSRMGMIGPESSYLGPFMVSWISAIMHYLPAGVLGPERLIQSAMPAVV